ncbi:MAG: V4R domain-containing protein [Candidatus Hodarchaeales archaeon]
MITLSQIQEFPSKNMILLVGPPGAGKSAFCEQAVLQSLSIDRPIIFVTTEYDPSEVKKVLRERGLGEIEPGLLSFIDAYNETVGLSVSDRSDTVYADCNDLSSIDIAISKLQDRIGKNSILLVFDSLTSPYLFSGSEILRFMKQTLSRFAAKGNAVIACIDEGCGKQEDLVAMMSQAHGIFKIEMEEDQRILNMIKHPKMEATKLPFSVERAPRTIPYEINLDIMHKFGDGKATSFESLARWKSRKKLKDGVDILWYQIVFWGGLHWDPERFPSLLYNMTKDQMVLVFKDLSTGGRGRWYSRWFMRRLYSFMKPKNFSVKYIKKLIQRTDWQLKSAKIYRMEYLDEISRDDEHHIRKGESPISWGFPKVDASLCFHDAAEFAGIFTALDREGRDWNTVEYSCMGNGDPYCEIKVVPEKSSEFQNFLKMVDATKLEKINEHFKDRILDIVLRGKRLPERPTLGNQMHYHEIIEDTSLLATYSERYKVALRLAGANSGRKMAELLLDNGVKEAQATKHLIDFFQYTNAGRLAVDETVRIEENCESYGLQVGQSLCFFTTSFLNGFFSNVKNQHLKETKCQAAGDSYCEWEFR